MPDIMFLTLNEVVSQEEIGSTTRNSFHKTQKKYTEKQQYSVVTVRSHLRKKRGKGRKKNKHVSSTPGKHMRTMDIASFREISRIERADNEMLRASIASNITKEACKKKTSQLWNGFWKNAVRMEGRKNKNTKTVVQSKDEKKKKVPTYEEVDDMDDIPISKLLLHESLSFWESLQQHRTKTKY